MTHMPDSPHAAAPASPADARRHVLYQVLRAGDRFEVGDGPFALGMLDALDIGRGTEGLTGQTHTPRLAVDDPWMSTSHARLVAQRAGTGAVWIVEDPGSTNGILVNGRRVKRAVLVDGDVLETGRTFWVYRQESAPWPAASEPYELGDVSTWSPALRMQIEACRAMHDTRPHALLVGPAGTGKGFLARALAQALRPGGPSHVLDCKGRTAVQLQRDLFGDPPRPGLLQQLHQGTLVLEHVDALPLALQNRMVDELMHGAVQLDGTRLRSHTSVLATTSLEPAALPRGERLSAALFQTMGQNPIVMPTMPARRQDVGLLVDAALASAEETVAVSRDVCRLLMLRHLPGHAGGLMRVLDAAAMLAGAEQGENAVVDVRHMPVLLVGPRGHGRAEEETTVEIEPTAPGAIAGPPRPGAAPSAPTHDLAGLPARAGTAHDVTEAIGRDALGALGHGATDMGPTSDETDPWGGRAPSARYDLHAMERSYAQAIDPDVLIAALKRSRGNVSAAARFLGKPRALVQQWLREFNIQPADHRDG